MSALDLRTIARALGGEVSGRSVLAPGPGHSPGDRSLSVRLSHQSPTGFVVFSHSGDDFRASRDYVAQRLGFGPDAWRRRDMARAAARPELNRDNIPVDQDDAARIARARALWESAGPAQSSIVETYLDSRGLHLDLVDNINEVIRYHPHCPWRDDAIGQVIRVPAMVAALRQVQGDEITGVHRTRLSPEGTKLGRRMLGQAGGAAVKLDGDDSVTMGLHLAEGVETALAGRQLGFKPCWALGSAGGIRAFPLLDGIECLTLLAENDPTNARAVEECAARWHEAGREVVIIEPTSGSDLNDAMRGDA